MLYPKFYLEEHITWVIRMGKYKRPVNGKYLKAYKLYAWDAIQDQDFEEFKMSLLEFHIGQVSTISLVVILSNYVGQVLTTLVLFVQTFYWPSMGHSFFSFYAYRNHFFCLKFIFFLDHLRFILIERICNMSKSRKWDIIWPKGMTKWTKKKKEHS